MKGKNILTTLSLIIILAACAGMRETAQDSGRNDVLYTCSLGNECMHHSVSTQTGKCVCGAPLKWGHVLRVQGNVAVLCRCAKDCNCSGLDMKNPAHCGCGSKVHLTHLKDKKVYFCNCGGGCFCNHVSKKPGKCKCGMHLKKV